MCHVWDLDYRLMWGDGFQTSKGFLYPLINSDSYEKLPFIRGITFFGGIHIGMTSWKSSHGNLISYWRMLQLPISHEKNKESSFFLLQAPCFTMFHRKKKNKSESIIIRSPWKPQYSIVFMVKCLRIRYAMLCPSPPRPVAGGGSATDWHPWPGGAADARHL